MQNLGPTTGPISSESNEFLNGTEPGSPQTPADCVFAERFPLRFPKERWQTLDAEERQELTYAQLVLESLQPIPVRTLRALVADTQLEQDVIGPALGVLDDLGLICWDDEADDNDLLVKLIATPDEHLQVQLPDGEMHWIFIARPLEDPNIPKQQLN